MSVELNVQERYAEGAQEKQEALCCPVDYQKELLELLPQEIIEKDYGCGDPSRYVREGDVVLDLGSGGGKVCYMAAQLVGENGHVHGVDMTDEMLALANKYKAEMAEKLGGHRVSFHKGFIQDLAFDLEAATTFANAAPLANLESVHAYELWKKKQARQAPMIADASISLVISNCVLNLVEHTDRENMLREIYRVLKPGGRVAISDIVSNKVVPKKLQEDERLWSGCISGAFHEREFLQAFKDIGFSNVAYDKWDETPWQVVEDIEFRSVTLIASKPLEEKPSTRSECEVMYVGPYSQVIDDGGHCFHKGERTKVDESTFQLLKEDASFVLFGEQAQSSSCCAPAQKTKSSCC
ncbi:MAG: methyltransferase domain-containing protein [Agarilytica sp.]